MAESSNVEKHWFPLDDEQELDFIKVLHGRFVFLYILT